MWKSKMAVKKALLLLAEGAEEMEVVITTDILRRAGIQVTVAGVSGCEPVKCSRQMVLVPDVALRDVDSMKPFDVVVLPGGMGGARTLAATGEVGSLLREQEGAGRLNAAICAAPIALKSHQIAIGKSVTSHPVVRKEIEAAGYNYKEERVVHDGNVITSRGPGTAFEFAFKIIELLMGKEKLDEIKPPLILNF